MHKSDIDAEPVLKDNPGLNPYRAVSFRENNKESTSSPDQGLLSSGAPVAGIGITSLPFRLTDAGDSAHPGF